jgi:hypothetical protein
MKRSEALQLPRQTVCAAWQPAGTCAPELKIYWCPSAEIWKFSAEGAELPVINKNKNFGRNYGSHTVIYVSLLLQRIYIRVEPRNIMFLVVHFEDSLFYLYLRKFCVRNYTLISDTYY